MKQSKLGSLIETTINTLIGFIVSYMVWPIAASIWSLQYNHHQHIGIVMFFTFISIIRGYLVRRYANRMIHSASTKIASSWIR